MATKIQQNKLKKNKLKSAYLSNNNDSSTNNLKSQLDNYKTRFQSAGQEDPTDTRNWLEKALNLEQDQNVLFDIFEIIGRPQQALFGAIDAGLSGENILTGAKEGLTGERDTSGKDLLVDHLGMKDEEGKLNLVDVLGFGLDVVADPVDAALVAATVGTGGAASPLLAAKKGVDVASDTAKVARTASKAIDTAADVAKAANIADNVADAAKVTYKFAPFQKGALSASDLAFRGIGKGIKKGAQLGDNVLEAVFKKVDDVKGINTLGAYQDIKKGASKILDSSKNLSGLTNKARQAINTSELNQEVGKIYIKSLDDKAKAVADNIARSTGQKVDDVYDEIARKLNTAVEANYDWTIRGDEIINELKQNKNIDLFTKENAESLVRELKNYGIKADIDGRYVKLIDNKQKVLNLTDEFADKVFGNRLSVEDIQDIDEAKRFFAQNDELSSLYNEANTTLSDIAKASDVQTGVAAQNITREGYVPHVLTDDTKEFLNSNKTLRRGSNSQFNTRKYNMTANEANRLKQRQLTDARVKVSEGIKKKGEVFKTDNEGNVILDKDGNYVRNEEWFESKIADKKAHIEDLKRKEISANEMRKLKDGLDIDTTKLTSKDAKKLDAVRKIDEYQNTVKELKSIKLDSIPVENSDAIDNARLVINDYKKSQTKLINALKNNADDATIKTLKEESDALRKQVTVQINKLKQYADSSSVDAIKKAKKAFKEGSEAGRKLQKAELKLDKAVKLKESIISEAGTMSTKLKETIKYQEAALDKFIKAEDKIWNKQVESLTKLYESDKVLASREGQEFLQTSFFENMGAYVNRNAQFSKGAQVYNEALQTGIFGNKQYVKFADDLKDGKVPYNFEKVNGTYIKNKLSKFNGILPENSKNAASLLESFTGKDVYIDKDLAKLLRVSSQSMSNELHPLLKLWDGMNNTFKKFSTLTFGFHFRNMSGNMMNMALSGMPVSKMPEYYKKAGNLWNKSDELMQKFVTNSLSETDKVEWSILEDFYKAGFSQAFTKGQGFEEIAEQAGKGVVNKITSKSLELNNALDSYNRLALLMYAKDNPQFVSNLGRKSAIDAVKYALFDPSNISDFERNVMKRAIPFYTFTKQNLMFQADNLMRNAPRYNKLYKFIRDSYNDLDENSYYQYQKDSMQIPLPFQDSNGNQLFIKTNLPLSDLGEYLENPLQRVVSSTSPIIRTPFEMVTGVNTFTGEKLNYNTADKLAKTLGIALPKGVQNTASLAEQILNGFGLQNVSTNLVKKLTTVLESAQGDATAQQLWSQIFNSILQTTNQENVELNNVYNDLELYQNEVNRLKKQGIDIPTIREITTSNKLKVNNLKKKRASSK